MEQLQFSHNWNNKLECKFYTTLRLLSPKYQLGKCFEVYMKGKKLHTVQIAATTFLQLDQINGYIAGLDTGYTVGETKAILRKMYPHVNWQTQKLVLVLLQVITEQEAQQFTPPK